jgi:hypothetical protein
VIAVPPGTRRLELHGRNMLPVDGQPDVRLDGHPLTVAEADEHRLLVELPEHAAGALEVELGDGRVAEYEIEPAHPAWAAGGQVA